MRITKSVRQIIRSALCAVILVAGGAVSTAQAQVNVAINVAPPPIRYEVVPRLNNGYAWAPGYWSWHRNHYVWKHGRQIVQRPGHYWVPDHWASGNHYRAGYWQPLRHNRYQARHWGGGRHVERHHGRHGHGGGKGRHGH